MRKHTLILAELLLVYWLVPAVVHGQTTWYVHDDASTGGDGTTWSTAYKYLQDALAASTAGDEIRVAGGTYKPDQDEAGNVALGDREATFLLLNGVAVRGGYAGYGAVDPDERDVAFYEALLSGDLNDDDAPAASNCCWPHAEPGCGDAICEAAVCESYSECCVGMWAQEYCATTAASLCNALCGGLSDNSFHVVTASGTDESAVLEGFTIRAGNADGVIVDDSGGGILAETGSPTIARCVFVGNRAYTGGGAIANLDGSNGTFAQVQVLRSLGYLGGGMMNRASSPIVINSTFLDNAGGMGGAIGNEESANPTLIGCVLVGNMADYVGGAICEDGGASSNLVNCTVCNNSILDDSVWGEGGGMYTLGGLTTVTNSIFWGNIDGGGGDESAQIHSWSEPPVISYSCIQGCSEYCDDGTIQRYNIAESPQFVDADGVDNIPGTPDDDYRLLAGSPGIDAGNNALVPLDVHDLDDDGDTAEPLPLDANGRTRFADDLASPDCPQPGADCGTPPIVDMGAYEFQGSGEPIPTVSEWGMAVMTLLLLTAGTLVFIRRQRAME